MTASVNAALVEGVTAELARARGAALVGLLRARRGEG
jgi:hypothetical protein